MQGTSTIEAPLTKEVAFVTYESTLVKHRLQFQEYLIPLLSDQDTKTMLLFWIYFSSQGVGMTEPVEDWIRRAGNKCKELGYQELGEQLCKHAIHEAGHQEMMIEDTKRLIDRWNKSFDPQLEATAVLKTSPFNAVIQYQDLHENYIKSEKAYCQIAIEYEIENLSATYGSQVLGHTVKVLGEDIKHDLSFLDDHIKIDVAHTQFNKKVISNFLTAYPETLQALINAGTQALNIYGGFLASCYKKAKTN